MSCHCHLTPMPYLILFMLIFTTSIGLASNKERKMENVWNQYIDYWKKHDKGIKTNLGDSNKDIKEVEDFFHKELPNSLKESLILQYHYSRRGENNLRYSWFGDLIETNLLTSKMIIEEYLEALKSLDINKNDMKNIYIGDIRPYTKKGWTKDWIPILVRRDVDITLFLDLRNDSNRYGQVLAILPYAETDDNRFHNRFAFISDSFEGFMQEALDYIRMHKGLDNAYFLKKLKLPMNYFQ